MNRPLRILLLEDNLRDAELMMREIRRAGLIAECCRVDNGPDFFAAVESAPDIILSDYNLPQFNGVQALDWLRGRGLDIPFILISGTVGEEAAVEAMKRGANDYLLKDRIARLGHAVEHVLAERRHREHRHRVEHELALAHERLREILAHSPAIIYTLELKNDRIAYPFVSDNVRRILGISKTMVSHEWWRENLHAEDRGRIEALAAEALQGSGYSTEYRIRHSDGSYRWIEDNLRVVGYEGGPPRHAIGIWMDISERKQLEEEVALRERRLTSFFKGATAGLAILDQQLRFVHVNDTLAAINGTRGSDHIGRTLEEMIPALALAMETHLRRVVAEGIPVLNVEFSGETPAQPGVERHWIGSYFPIAGSEQSAGAVGVMIVEITERKRAEQELTFRNVILSTQQETLALPRHHGPQTGGGTTSGAGGLARCRQRCHLCARSRRLDPFLEPRGGTALWLDASGSFGTGDHGVDAAGHRSRHHGSGRTFEARQLVGRVAAGQQDGEAADRAFRMDLAP